MAKYEKMTDQDFEVHYQKILDRSSVTEIEEIPGVSDIVREYLNNEILDSWAEENRELSEIDYAPDSEKLNELLEASGFDTFNDFLTSGGALNEVVPGICMNEGCDYTTDVESDASHSFCESCGTKSVRSIMVLVGL